MVESAGPCTGVPLFVEICFLILYVSALESYTRFWRNYLELVWNNFSYSIQVEAITLNIIVAKTVASAAMSVTTVHKSRATR